MLGVQYSGKSINCRLSNKTMSNSPGKEKTEISDYKLCHFNQNGLFWKFLIYTSQLSAKVWSTECAEVFFMEKRDYIK